MNLCIPKEIADSLKAAIKNKEVSIMKLTKMESDERLAVFQKYLKDENLAKKLNLGFETRMKSETDGILQKYITRELDKVSPANKKDLMVRITKLKNALGTKEGQPFLTALAEQKIGTKITAEEAQNLFKYANDVKEAKDTLVEAMSKGKVPLDDPLRYKFMAHELALTKYSEGVFLSRSGSQLDELIATGKGIVGSKDMTEGAARLSKAIWGLGTNTLGSILKTAMTIADNGFFGKQGIKALGAWHFKDYFNTFGVSLRRLVSVDKNQDLIKQAGFSGSKGFLSPENAKGWKAWVNISHGSPMLDMELMDLYRSDNYINGVYQKAANGFAMDILKRGEEAYPDSLLSGIWGVGRVVKVSEDLYNTSALRLRRKLADAIIATATSDKWGLDLADKKIADTLGGGVGSLSGRAYFGKYEHAAEMFNTLAFSARLLKSTTDTYWHAAKFITHGDEPAARIIAKENLKVWGSIASVFVGILAIEELSEQMLGEPVVKIDLHPTSSTFGYITPRGGQPFDPFGGVLSVARTFARVFDSKRFDPRLGVFVETPFWQRNTDEIGNYLSNKTNPLLSFYSTIVNKEHFGGDPISYTRLAKDFLLPITSNTVFDALTKKINLGDSIPEMMSNADFSSAFQFLMWEGNGFSTRDMKWNPAGKEWKALKQVDEKKYWQAVDTLATKMDVIIKELRADKDYQIASEDDQSKIAQKALKEAQSETISSYSQFIPELTE